MAQLYSIVTPAVALVAATAKTAVGVVSSAADDTTITEIVVSFDGVTASAVPVLVELCTYDATTTGTRTTGTAAQITGRISATGASVFHTYTVEPTVLTVIYSWNVTPNGGLLDIMYPLGREPGTDIGKGIVLRLTAPAIVNARAALVFEG